MRLGKGNAPWGRTIHRESAWDTTRNGAWDKHCPPLVMQEQKLPAAKTPQQVLVGAHVLTGQGRRALNEGWG